MFRTDNLWRVSQFFGTVMSVNFESDLELVSTLINYQNNASYSFVNVTCVHVLLDGNWTVILTMMGRLLVEL